jgi:hypothetical protein
MPEVLRLIVTMHVVVPAPLNVPGLHDTPVRTAEEEPNEANGKQANNRLSKPARHRRKPG